MLSLLYAPNKQVILTSQILTSHQIRNTYIFHIYKGTTSVRAEEVVDKS